MRFYLWKSVDNIYYNGQYFPAGSPSLLQFQLQFRVFKLVPLIFRKPGISLKKFKFYQKFYWKSNILGFPFSITLFQIDMLILSIQSVFPELKFIENIVSKKTHYIKSTFITNREKLFWYVKFSQGKYMHRIYKNYWIMSYSRTISSLS